MGVLIMAQFRPKGSTGPMYNPQRDLAYCYMPALEEAVKGLTVEAAPSWLKDIAVEAEVTEDTLASAVQTLLNAHELFITDLAIREPAEALEKSGFLYLPPAVRILLLYRLGEVLMGGFFVAIRDVTRYGELPPDEVGLERGVAAGRVISEALAGVKHVRPEQSLAIELETARALAEKHESRAERLEAELRCTKADCQKASRRERALASRCDQLAANVANMQRMSLWQHLTAWVRYKLGLLPSA